MYLFISVFSIYLVTISTNIYVGDSPLLAAAAYSIGTAHPPGYPLYVILGKLMTFLPFGNIAFKANIVGSVFGALTAVLISKSVNYMTGNRYAAVAAAVFFSLTPVVWMQSVIAKGAVYTLNAFLCSVIFLLTVRIIKEDGSFYKQSFLIAFFIGLGMGNHHTIPMMGLAVVPVFFMRWREIGFKWAVFTAIFFLTGLSVNLLLYIRSVVAITSGIDFLYSFGGSFDSFIGTFLRKQYKNADTVVALKATSNLVSNFLFSGSRVIADIIVPNIKYAGSAFVVLGLISNLKDKRILVYIFSLFIFWIILLGNLTAGIELTEEHREVISVYYTPLFAILAIMIGSGIAFVLKKAQTLMQTSFIPRFLAVSAVALPLCLAPQTFAGVSASTGNSIAYLYVRDMLTVLPLKTLLLHYNDNPTFTTFYMKSVEKYRDDVLMMNAGGSEDHYGLETSPQWKYSIFYPEFYSQRKTKISYLDREFALKGRLYTSNPKDMTDVIRKHYNFNIQALTARLYPKGDPPDDEMTDTLFLKSYDFLNFEYMRSLPALDDFLAVELLNHYALGQVIYGDIMNRRGDAETGQKALRESFAMGDPKSFLGPYIKYMISNNKTDEALVFLRKLENGPEGRYAAVAHILEYKALSVIGRKEEADNKYSFIREKKLASFLNTRF